MDELQTALQNAFDVAGRAAEAAREEAARYLAPKAPPYSFCRTPDKCAGKGYCPRDIACND